MTGTIQRAVQKGPPAAADESVAVTVNGAERRVPPNSSVADLLASLSIDARSVVVEHNAVILRDREKLGSVKLNEDDTLEIVHFVGGG